MMDRMRRLEPERAVHQAVCPIKPCVMRKEVQEDRQRQIPNRVIANIAVNQSPTQIVPSPGNDTRRNAINRGTRKAPADFAADLLV